MSRVQQFNCHTGIPLWFRLRSRRNLIPLRFRSHRNQHSIDNSVHVGIHPASSTCPVGENTGPSERCTICLRTIQGKNRIMHYAAHKRTLPSKLRVWMQNKKETRKKWQQVRKQFEEIKKRKEKNNRERQWLKQQILAIKEVLVKPEV